jgi:hypothetical protein
VKCRPLRSLAGALGVTLVASCGLVTREGGPTDCAVASARPATVVTRPAVPTAPRRASNVVVEVNNTLAESARVRVRFSEALALDVRIPGTDARCSTQPVYKYGYRVPPGQVAVSATSGIGREETATLHVGQRKRWLVIVVQKGFPLSVQEWSERPAWG